MDDAIKPFGSSRELVRAADLSGPLDFYAACLTVKHGFGDGCTLGFYSITKAQARRAGIRWDFVESTVRILSLAITNRHGRHGHSIHKP